MANAQLSREAAKLFGEYKVPIDTSIDWAVEINSANSVNDLSLELQEFLADPYYMNLPEGIEDVLLEKHLAGKHDQRTHGRRASAETIEFSDNEKSAIEGYTRDSALQINAKLRGQRNVTRIGVWQMTDAKIDEAVKNLDSAIDKSKLSKKLTLQRDVPASSIKNGVFNSVVGKTITDKGFLSLRNQSSDDSVRLKGFVKMVIDAPEGATALDMSFLNPNSMNEIIFPRGTKIKVTSFDGETMKGEIVE